MAESMATRERGADESVSSDEEVREKPSSLKQTTDEEDVPEMTLAMLTEELDTITDPLKLGLCLGIKQHFIRTIQANHRNHVEGQRRDVFTHIASNNISLNITWERIASVLEEFLNMRDLARSIRIKFKYSLQDCSPRPAPTLNPRLSTYRDYLTSRYKAQISTSVTQWPPVPVRKVFKLAMIKKENIQRGEIDNDFVRMSITGKVDDILQHKVPVDLDNIFSETEDNRKFVLIEGAPGSGKSTLALHMCQEWGKGNLFQNYDNVILVRLRDPLVRKAKTIADLLPCSNKAMANDAEAVITSLYGKGVLWVLDGWDELPSDLPQDSIINKLVRPGLSQESSLHECAVIVTSRPSSSAELHPLVSSRVEVLGFTPHELEQYLTECVKGDLCALQDLLQRIRENPVVEGSCYLPLNAAIIAHVFLSGNQTLPTSNHEIFASVVKFSLSRFMQDRLGKPKKDAMVATLDKLPRVLRRLFDQLCQLAHFGVVNNKVTFVPDDLKATGVTVKVCEIGLLQAVPSILVDSQEVYYSFLHLSIQELLAAVHISHMSSSEQISVFQELFGNARFNAVFQFYAGITKLKTCRSFLSMLPRFVLPNTPRGILELVSRLTKDGSKLLSLLHCLYEAEDPSLCRFVAEQSLDLSSTTLSPLDCLSVGYFLSVVSTTTRGQFTVELYGCSIDDQGCKFLTQGLCKCLDSHSTITPQLDLSLRSNDIHEEGTHHISQLLKNTSIVRKLNLSFNDVGGDGIKSLCEALVTNNTLEELQLSKCSITVTDINGPCLTELLIRNNSLKVLNLSVNNLTNCRHLARGLKDNTSLRELCLYDCDLKDENVEDLCVGLNNCIEVLGIGWNNAITIKGLTMLASHLTTPTRLRTLLIPKHLKSSIPTLFSKVNEERRRSGLSEIEVKAW